MLTTKSNYVIQTQIARIRETIESLKNGEYLVRLRLNSNEVLIRKDNHNHSNEIIWGWEQLIKEILTLPDNFIDKSFYNEIARKGLEQAAKLLQKTQDQYFEERDPYPVDLNTGRELRWLE